jgi:drug/metabolite transporter (DMT)-like permease
LSTHTKAILQALLVTFLWSTSWVLIKFGLHDLPALTFAGMRYSIAFLILLVWAWRRKELTSINKLHRSDWVQLIALGVLFYALTQGTQFLALAYLPAVSVNVFLNFTAVLVAFFGWGFLREKTEALQWAGVILSLLGAWIYFYPVVFPKAQLIGYLAAGVGVLANAVSSLLGREINRRGNVSPLMVTLVSMGIGAGLLLGTGIRLERLPALNPLMIAIILWLALVNTAFAFTIWNQTLQTLSAVESSVLNSTMLIQIPILAVVFLDEKVGLKGLLGLVIAGVGVLLVQLKRRKSKR